MNKDEVKLVKEYAKLSTDVANSLKGLEQAIREINHTNILHTTALEQNTLAIKNIKSFWGTIVKWLVIAIIILAGVEKATKLFGL